MRTGIKLISFIFLLSFCNSKHEIHNEFKEEKIVIDFKDNIFSTTFFWFSVDYDNGKPVYLLVDELYNLVKLDFDNQALMHSMNIPRGDGPLGIKGGIWSPSLGLDDNYLIEGPFQYFFMKKNGEIQSKVDVTEKITNKLQEEYGIISKGLFIRTNGGHFKDGEKIIVSICRTNKIDDNEFPVFPQFASISFLNQETIEVEILNIEYPKELIETDYKYVGQAEIPNYYFKGDWLVYNFLSFRETFFYNLRTQEKRKVRLNTTHGLEDKAVPFGENPNESVIKYGFPLVDFDKEIIYRYHIVIDPESIIESENYLCAYNFDGKLVSEAFLGKNSERMLRNSVLIGDYVYMNNFFQSSDDQIEFSRFRLQNNN